MCGVGFAGKSTLSKKIAEHKNGVLVSQDDIYFEKEKEWNLDENSDEDWDRVLNVSKERIKENLSNSNSVVFDHVNLKHSHRKELIDMAKEFEAKTIVVYLDTPLDIQKGRQLKNKETKKRHNVKQEFLDEALEELEIPHESESVFVFTPETDIESWLNKLP